jgi:glycosyltransferase involved in cell wall biosynthesis
MRWPKITLVTPCLNAVRYIEQTFRSVIFQGYPNLEYIVVDGGSTDGTLEIIRKYEQHFTWWISEPDQGMYDALNKGFARSSGEIMGWISATDMLHVGSLFVVGSVFRDLPQVEWITGIPTGFNEEGMTVGVGAKPPRWSWPRFLMGANHYIQQESTFWRRSLWDRAGGYVDASLRNGGDFELWVRFFRHAKLYPVNALIGGYRFHFDSLGLQNLKKIHEIHDEIVAKELKCLKMGPVKIIAKLNPILRKIPKVRGLWWNLFTKNLYRVPWRDLPPLIEYDGQGGWKIQQ